MMKQRKENKKNIQKPLKTNRKKKINQIWQKKQNLDSFLIIGVSNKCFIRLKGGCIQMCFIVVVRGLFYKFYFIHVFSSLVCLEIVTLNAPNSNNQANQHKHQVIHPSRPHIRISFYNCHIFITYIYSCNSFENIHISQLHTFHHFHIKHTANDNIFSLFETISLPINIVTHGK